MASALGICHFWLFWDHLGLDLHMVKLQVPQTSAGVGGIQGQASNWANKSKHNKNQKQQNQK